MKKKTTTTARRSRIGRLIKGGVLTAGLLAVGPFTEEFAGVPVSEATAQRVYGDKFVVTLWIIDQCWFDCPGVGFFCCGDVA